MKRILITGAGGPAAISFLRAIQHEPVEVFAADMDPIAPGLFLVPQERRCLIPPGDAPHFVAEVLGLCEAHEIDMVVPTVDVELLQFARAKSQFDKLNVGLLLASRDALSLALDKFALVAGVCDIVPVPRTWLASSLPEELGDFPLIAKPRRGSGSRGITLINSRADLERIPATADWLVQEFLPGTEYSVDVLSGLDGVARVAVPRARLKVDSGVAVVSRTVHDPELEHLAKLVADRLALTFVSNIQFRRRADGRPALLEVNPRFPGTMPLTIHSGIDMPVLALRTALGATLGPLPRFREVAMVRTFQEHMMSVEELEGVAETMEKSAA